MTKVRVKPDPSVRQLSFEIFNRPESLTDIIVHAVRSLEGYIDTTTWLLAAIGPLKYCTICKGISCSCEAGPMFSIEHEMLKVGDVYTNIGEAVPHLAENNSFPIGSVFITKFRTVTTCQLNFKKVCQRKSGAIFLAEDIPMVEIEEIVDWARLLNVINKRLEYSLKASEARKEVNDYSMRDKAIQLNIYDDLEP